MQYPIPPGAPTRLNQSTGGPISILNNGPGNLYLYRNSACSVLGAYDAIIGSGGAYTTPGGELWGVSDGTGLTCVVLTGAGLVNTGTTTVSGVVSVGNTVQVAGTVATTTAPSGGSSGGTITGKASTPVTVDTVNNAQATAYGNQRRIDRCQNGVLWAMYNVHSNGNLYLSYSVDNGVTWTPTAQLGSASTAYLTNGSLFIDLDDYAHVVFKDSTGTGYLYYTRGTPNSNRTQYTWSSYTLVTINSSWDYPDLVAFRDPAGSGGYFVHIVASNTAGVNTAILEAVLTVSASGTISSPTRTTLDANYPNSGLPTWPSLDFRHTGDGKTVASGQPDLFVGWSAGTTGSGYGIRFMKAAYSGGSWTWGTEREIGNTLYVDNGARWLTCMFDGARVILVGELTSGSPDYLTIYERDAADTATIQRYLSSSLTAAAEMVYGSAGYDANGNIYLFGGSADSSQNIGYQIWTRATATIGARQNVSSASNYAPCVSVRRGSAGTRIDYIYTFGASSPYTIKAGNIT